MFNNWFGKGNTDVRSMKSIEIKPEIVIPKKTTEDLYDLAVREVQKKRVSELILRELMDICVDPERMEDTKKAIEYTGGDSHAYDDEQRKALTDMFPKAYIYRPGTYTIIKSPSLTLHTLADRLADQFLGAKDAE